MRSSTPKTGWSRKAHRRVVTWRLAVGLMAGGSIIPADAAIRTWSGLSATSGNWNTSANWVGGTVPTAGDSLVFPAGPTRLITTNNFVAHTTFAGISMGSAGYALHGNPITLTGGLSGDFAGGNCLIALSLRLGASQTISASLGSGQLFIGGSVDLQGYTLTLSGSGNSLLSGAIAGTGNVTKTGSGLLEFVGTVPNTYTGRTTVNQGVLVLARYFGGGLISVPGELVIGDGSGGAGADRVRLQAPDQIGNAGEVTVNSSGWLELNGWSDTLGSLTLTSGLVDTDIGTLTLAGDVSALGSGTATINGRLNLGSGTRIIDVASSGLLRINAVVSGTGGWIKTGTGYLNLAGANTFSGVCTVQGGLVDVEHDSALGSTAGRTFLQSGILRLNGSIVSGEPLTASGGKFQGLGATNAWTGSVTLSNTVTIEVTSEGQVLNLSGVMGGPGGFTKTGAGALLLSGTGANTFEGDVEVESGALLLDKDPVDGALPGPGRLSIGNSLGGLEADVVRVLQSYQINSTVDMAISDSGLLDLNGYSETLGAIDLAGGQITTGTGVLTLSETVSATSTSNGTARIYGRMTWISGTRTFDVRVGRFAPELFVFATISGSGSLLKAGDGWLALAGSNSYGGLTTVASGGLVVEDDNGLGSTAAGTVVEEGGALILGGARVGNESLTFNATAVPNASALMATVVIYSNSWAGPIAIASPIRVQVTSASIALNLAGAISGAGGMTKSGPGTLILSGSSGNTYGGDTVVNEGLLDLAKNAGTGVAVRNGRLRIGDGFGGASADRVRFQSGNQLWSTVAIDIAASGLLDLNGYADTVGPITFSGGRATSGAGGILSLASSVTTVGGSGTLDGRVELSGMRTFHVADEAGSVLNVNATVTGVGGITKTGPGQVYLNSSNTYQGLTTVTGGRMYLDNDDALGSAAAGCAVDAGAAVVLRNGAHIGNEPLTLNGLGNGNLGALASIYGSNSWAGEILVSSATRLTTLNDDDVLVLSGAIGGARADVTLEGAGVVIYSGAAQNTYEGATRVYGGTLVLNKSGANRAVAGNMVIGDGLGGVESDVVRLEASTQIANSSDLLIAGSGLLDLDDHGDAIDLLRGTGRVDLGSGFLNVGADGGSGAFEGVIRGSGTVTKLGAGTITFNGANLYTGNTSVGGGVLVINGAQPSSAVTVAAASTLGGGGTVGTITSTSGRVSPGASPGRLSSGNLLLDGGSTFVTELSGSMPGSLYDQLKVVGTVNLAGAALSLVEGLLAPAPTDVYLLIDNDGADPVVGTFAGLANGATLTLGARQFRIYYNGGSGNDVVLQPVGIPLSVAGVTVRAGNNDGAIDPNECDDLVVSLFNGGGTNAVTGIEATLTSTTVGVIATHARVQFPDIPAATARAGATTFQISASPFLTCGTLVDFVLTVETASHGAFKLPFRLPSGSVGSRVQFPASDTPMAILDSASVTSTVNVAGISAPLAKVTVSIHATHANLADLDISLIAPDGTTLVLTSDNGGDADGYGTGCEATDRTVFDWDAPTGIAAGSAPFEGTYRPESNLDLLVGLAGADVNGAWKLKVTDDAAGSSGALNCWTLNLYPAICLPGSGRCQLCGDTVLTGVMSLSDPDANQLVQNGVASSCGMVKPCPGASGGSSEFQAYSFFSGHSNACVTVTVESPCPATNALTSAAYLGSYNPLAICANYLADSGAGASVGSSRAYSFNVPPNTNFWVVVQMNTDNAPCSEYALTVSGADCRPALALTRTTGPQVLLTWPTYASGYRLESTNRLGNPPNAFGPVSPLPGVLDSRYVVTNTATGTRYYRLKK